MHWTGMIILNTPFYNYIKTENHEVTNTDTATKTTLSLQRNPPSDLWFCSFQSSSQCSCGVFCDEWWINAELGSWYVTPPKKTRNTFNLSCNKQSTTLLPQQNRNGCGRRNPNTEMLDYLEPEIHHQLLSSSQLHIWTQRLLENTCRGM